MSSAIKKWPTLDILRGLAVVCMLVNHAAVHWLDQQYLEEGLTSVLSFLGSFAPVLFFFTTGVGYGLAHQVGKTANTKDLLIKAGILIVADIFMRGGNFTVIGWDFLAFIAFSMILLHGFRGRRFGVAGALVLVVVLLVVRFGVGAFYDSRVSEEEQSVWIRISLGLEAMDGVSYWFTPWFVYPLVGFIFGAFLRQYRDIYDQYTGIFCALALVCAVGAAAVSYVLLMKGAGLFRWGTMSINFFVASVSCVLAATAIACTIGDKFQQQSLSQHLSNALSMQGVSSLAVVPIHYFFLALVEQAFALPFSPNLYLGLLIPWLVVCFWCARATNRLTVSLTSTQSSTLLKGLLALVVASALICSIFVGQWWLFIVMFIAQYALCILLGFSYSKR